MSLEYEHICTLTLRLSVMHTLSSLPHTMVSQVPFHTSLSRKALSLRESSGLMAFLAVQVDSGLGITLPSRHGFCTPYDEITISDLPEIPGSLCVQHGCKADGSGRPSTPKALALA